MSLEGNQELTEEEPGGARTLRPPAGSSAPVSGDAIPGAAPTDATAPHVYSKLRDQPAPDHIRIPGYAVLRLVAAGGMGAVYEAEQERPRRRVALKIVRHGMATPRLLKRFEFEAQALGRMDHPGIAKVFEAGTFETSAGPQPFFAMEFIDGTTLRRYAKSRELGLRGKVELLIQICEAVEHAHQKGVIHRDLKAGNILVTEEGRCKILDFGLARALDGGGPTHSLETEAGQILGTLAYMSPEQTRGQQDIDTRSDVYSLGVIAYELLTGRHPHDKKLGAPELLRAIQEDDPPSASEIDTALRGDIESILGKALRKERDLRYASAGEFAADLRRFLADEPVLARPSSAFYHLRKFARRRKALVTGLGVGALSLIAGMAVSLHLARVANRERARAEAAADQAQAALEQTREAQRDAQREAAAAQYENYLTSLQNAQARINPGGFPQAIRTLLAAPEKWRGWEWGYLMNQTLRHTRPMGGRTDIRNPNDRVFHEATWTSDRQRILTLDNDGVQTWSPDAVPLSAVPISSIRFASGLDLNPDGTMVAVALLDGDVKVWNASDGSLLKNIHVTGSAKPHPVFSSTGRRLALSVKGETLHVFDTGTWSATEAPGIDALVFEADDSRDASTILLACEDGAARILDLANGAERVRFGGHHGAVRSARFSSNGARVLTGSSDHEARIWNAQNGELQLSLRGHNREITGVFFADADRRAITCSEDSLIKIWDTETGRETLTISQTNEPVREMRLSGDGRDLMVMAGFMVWSIPTAPWRAEDLPQPAGPESASWNERFRAWQEAAGKRWDPVPSPDAGPPIFAESFDTTDSLQRWIGHEDWMVVEGALAARPPDGTPHRIACLEVGRYDLTNHAVEVDVTAPENARFVIMLDVNPNQGPSYKGARGYTGFAFLLDRFNVNRGRALTYQSEGQTVGWGKYPNMLTNVRAIGERAKWTPKDKFRIRIEVRPNDYVVFIDGQYLTRYQWMGRPKGSVGLGAFLGDDVPRAIYDNFMVTPI